MKKRWMDRAFKRFTQRFGMLEVRPRYLRFAYFFAGLASALLLVLALAIWGGAGGASADARNLRKELDEARRRLAEGEGALSKLEATQSANQRLLGELRFVSDERASLEGDLLHFLPRVPAGTQDGQARLERLSASPDPRMAFAWHFSLWAGFYSGRQAREFSGRLAGTYTVLRAGKLVRLPWPAPGDMAADSEVKTRQWVRKSGTLMLQPGDQLKKVSFNLLQANHVAAAISVDF
jgi:hypothetical protein